MFVLVLCVICIGAVCQSPVLTGEILCEKLIGQVLSVGVGAVCHMHWCCMPVPSPNRGDCVWEAHWPRLATKLSLFSLIQPHLSQTGDCKICICLKTFWFSKAVLNKDVALFLLLAHALWWNWMFLHNASAGLWKTVWRGQTFYWSGHHTRSLASLDRSFRCHCAHSFIHCAMHVLIHTLLTRGDKTVVKIHIMYQCTFSDYWHFWKSKDRSVNFQTN